MNGDLQFVPPIGNPRKCRLGSQIQHVDVRSQAHVVSEIPAYVVGIVVDEDVIAVPQPVAAIVIVVGSDGEEEAANSEAIPASAMQSPDVTRSNPSFEVAVLPRMVNVIMCIPAAAVMTHPAIIFSVHMRSLRVSLLIVEFPVVVPLLFTSSRLRSSWRRAACWNMAVSYPALAATRGSRRCSMAVLLRQQW